MWALLTEHEFGNNRTRPGYYVTDNPPESAKFIEIKTGTLLVPCTVGASAFILRGLFTALEEAKLAYDELNNTPWDIWLDNWKKRHQS